MTNGKILPSIARAGLVDIRTLPARWQALVARLKHNGLVETAVPRTQLVRLTESGMAALDADMALHSNRQP